MNIKHSLSQSLALLLLVLIPLTTSYAFAHDVFSGATTAKVNSESGLVLEMHFASVTVEGFVTDLSGVDNQVSAANLRNIREHLETKAKNFYDVTLDGETLEVASIDIEVKNQEDAVSFILKYPGPLVGTLGLSGEFIQLTNPEYVSTLTVLDDKGVQLGLFIQTYNGYYSEVEVTDSGAGKPNSEGVFASFLYQGILHIVFGYDHLLFLMALLIVCHSWKPAIVIITSFTLAHTLTLSLAALNLLTPPAILIEIIIALTIIYVGVENLWSAHQPRVRWLLTGIFGLAHGFGFANMLRDLGLGAAGAPIVLPLFAFNLGVELGQLALALVFLPLLWQAQKLRAFNQWIQPGVSLSVIALGLYWAVERTLGWLA